LFNFSKGLTTQYPVSVSCPWTEKANFTALVPHAVTVMRNVKQASCNNLLNRDMIQEGDVIF